jgi:HEAT repeat protein
MGTRYFALPVMAVLLTAAATLTWAAGPDTSAADEQILKDAGVATTNDGLLEFLRKRTLNDNDQEYLKNLIRQLGDDSFQVRERASSQLLTRGAAAEPLLRTALQSSDIEVVRRAEECLRLLKRGAGAAVPAAVARLLGHRKVAGAIKDLLAFLPFSDNDSVAEAVRASLTALAVQDGKPDPLLVTALNDKDPMRRAAAAEALTRSGAAGQDAAIRKLLGDPEPSVRLHVAMVLIAAKEKDAIPVLIDLLGQMPAEQTRHAEEILLDIADEHAPDISPGRNEEERDKCRRAWISWWQEHGRKVDLARIATPSKEQGYTLVLLLDAGRAMELDKHDKPRWQVEGLSFPLDIQRLPGNRLLVAEHGANRVTVRNPKGDVIWEKQIEAPLTAQRLPNGNTFIATNNQMIEMTSAGKEIFSYGPPPGEYIMKAKKLDNGEIACVLSGSRFVRLDATGKEIKSFGVNVSTSGGRIDVLSSGQVVVPELKLNQLVIYDKDGKRVKTFPVEQPIAAVGLANGHFLVTSMTQQRAIELDADGKEVWQFKSDTRVSRAFRR